MKFFRSKLTLFRSLSLSLKKRKVKHIKKLFRNKNFVPKRWFNPALSVYIVLHILKREHSLRCVMLRVGNWRLMRPLHVATPMMPENKIVLTNFRKRKPVKRNCYFFFCCQMSNNVNQFNYIFRKLK